MHAVGSAQQLLYSALGCTAHTASQGCPSVCHSLMSRGEREALSAQPTHASVWGRGGVCVEMLDIYHCSLWSKLRHQ